MALASTTVWEVRTTGNDANGGGFNSAAAGTDRSQQDTAHVDIDGATITATVHTTTTQLNIVGYTVAAADVGNNVRISGGTATAGVYQITAADTANNRWTVDRAAGTAGQTATGKMGGAFASPAAASALLAGTANIVYIKAGTYTITTASNNVTGGCSSFPSNTLPRWIGYSTNRTLNNTDTKPLIQMQAGVSTTIMFQSSNNTGFLLYNLHLDGNLQTSSRGTGFGGYVFRCHFERFTNSATISIAIYCSATGCTTGVVFGSHALFTEAYSNSITPFSANNALYVNCLSYSNTGAGTDGFSLVNLGQAINCVAYGNTRDGIQQTGTGNQSIINCVAVNNGRFGFTFSTAVYSVIYGCSSYNNTSGNSGALAHYDIEALSATPFTDAASSDFSLNSTAGGGALLRGLGFPSVYLRGLTASYPDIGAAQHQDSGSGSTGYARKML